MIIKRFLDFSISLLLIILLSPLFLIISVLIKLTSKGPVLFKQERVGKDGYVFNMYKFRSMVVDLEAEKNFDFSKDGQRITTIGKFLRRTKIDELPQLLNVLKGDMSLIGPRPTILEQVKNYDSYQRKRLKVRPGMTGLAQVNGNVKLSWEERIEYDIYYIENYSLLLDLKILLKTIGVVLFGEGRFVNKNKKLNKLQIENEQKLSG